MAPTFLFQLRKTMTESISLASLTNTACVRDVHQFWNTEACGTDLVDAEKGTAEFYKKYRELRYKTEWHIPELVPFSETRGKKVLEIGCGNGADGVMFAQAGAIYTGVDLTEAAVEATRIHFRLLGLNGTFHNDDAEHLSFPSENFDFVYSHGVLHHTAHPERAFAEVYRVLRPGGKAILMLYHKHSFNYYVRIMTYMRLRLLLRIVGRIGRLSGDRVRVKDQLKGIRGNYDASVWQVHYENFLRSGWSYLRATNFAHHATDGPECPFAFPFTKRSVSLIFQQFRVVRTKVAHFPLRKYSLGKWIPLSVERQIASRMGWYLFVYLTK
jgi:ubiquinone/menaquinone biosynthesis C-methylase UbiE